MVALSIPYTDVLSLQGLKSYLSKMVAARATYSAQRDRATMWVEISPDLAASLLRYMMYSVQRKLVSRRIAVLIDAINKDDLLNNNLIWICVTKNDDYVIINSQHTLQAIVQAKKTIELQVVIDKVDSMSDVARRYAKFDIGGLRTASDIVDAADFHRCGVLVHDESYYVVASKKAVAAVSFINGAFVAGGNAGEKIANLNRFANDWVGEFETLNEKLRPLAVPLTLSENKAAPLINNEMKVLRYAFRQSNVVALFMVALRSHPTETALLLNALVDRARSGTPYDTSSIETLFMYLSTAKPVDLVQHKRRQMVLVNIVRCIIAYRECDDILIDQLYVEPEEMTAQESKQLWELLTDEELPRPNVTRVKVDRKSIVRGLFGAGASKA